MMVCVLRWVIFHQISQLQELVRLKHELDSSIGHIVRTAEAYEKENRLDAAFILFPSLSLSFLTIA